MIRKHREKASLTPVLFIQGLGKAPGFTYWHVWMHKNKMFGETEIQGNGYIHINTDTASNTGGVGLLNIQIYKVLFQTFAQTSSAHVLLSGLPVWTTQKKNITRQ